MSSACGIWRESSVFDAISRTGGSTLFAVAKVRVMGSCGSGSSPCASTMITSSVALVLEGFEQRAVRPRIDLGDLESLAERCALCADELTQQFERPLRVRGSIDRGVDHV